MSRWSNRLICLLNVIVIRGVESHTELKVSTS